VLFVAILLRNKKTNNMKKLSIKIRIFLLRLKYACMPTNRFLRVTNHSNFSLLEQSVIGTVLINRFETQEELEAKCEELFLYGEA
jgi:hypothetical protein